MDQVKKTPVVLVALAWLFVGVPWAWGVGQLWKNAQKLFEAPPSKPAATAPDSTAPATTAPATTPSSK